MKRALVALSILSLALLAPACPPSPQPPDSGTDGGSIYAAACANLAKLGCADGKAVNCASTLEAKVTERRSTVDLPCMTQATTPTEARACGPVCR